MLLHKNSPDKFIIASLYYNIMELIIKNLSKEQKDKLLDYSDFHLVNSDGITMRSRYVYRNARVVTNAEAWEKRSKDLDDIFYEGNYTIEDKAAQETK